jgi:hypothetical protein
VASFTFESGPIRSRYKTLDKKIDVALRGVMKLWDGRLEKHMKNKAPWTDRTTNARNGLFAQYEAGPGATAHSIVAGHSVYYGVFLETIVYHRNDVDDESAALAQVGTKSWGTYAIVGPAIERYAPKVIASCKKLLDRLH